MSNTHENKPRGLYRSRHGIILGVCRGLAEFLDISIFWTRVVALVLLFMSFGWAVIGYIIAALLMKPEPVIPFQRDEDEEFYTTCVSSRGLAVSRLKRTYDNLNKRIARIESIVTSRDYQWDKRFHE